MLLQFALKEAALVSHYYCCIVQSLSANSCKAPAVCMRARPNSFDKQTTTDIVNDTLRTAAV
jgi:hypothetical protein